MDVSQKKLALNKQRTIIIATINYLILQQSGSIVYDDFDPIKFHYEQERTQAEKYFSQGRLDKLEQKLKNLIKGLQHRIDLNFVQFIKTETGYDIDIFEDLLARANEIILKKEISTQQEMNDISLMLHYVEKTSKDKKAIELLFSLLTAYSKSAIFKKNNSYRSKIINNTAQEETIEIEIVSLPEPRSNLLADEEHVSPDGKRKIKVNRWSDGENASTYVSIIFPTASGAIYTLNGLFNDVNAYWKDNHHIVIETRKSYEPNTKHSQVSSFDDVIKISYIEN